MAVTIKDVSKDASVSIKTVSRVINNEANVAEVTKNKVLASVKKLGFKPNKPYIADVQSGIFNACKNTGYNLVIQECNYKSSKLTNDIIQFVKDFKIDGLVITPPLSDMQDFLSNLEANKIEHAVIAPRIMNPDSLYASSNDYEAAYNLTSEIIKHRHRDIGFIKGHPKHSASLLRFNGFLAAMKKYGFKPNEQWIKQGNFSFESGFDAGVQIFESSKIPTAIFASNDSMAAGIMKSAQMKGMVVPNDLSLTGFDDSPIAQQIWPALTTIKQPVQQMAAHAARILIAKFDGLVEKTKSKEFKSELVVRESLRLL